MSLYPNSPIPLVVIGAELSPNGGLLVSWTAPGAAGEVEVTSAQWDDALQAVWALVDLEASLWPPQGVPMPDLQEITAIEVALGTALADALIPDVALRAVLGAGVAGIRRVVLDASHPAVRALPWELIRLPGHLRPLGARDDLTFVRRVPPCGPDPTLVPRAPTVWLAAGVGSGLSAHDQALWPAFKDLPADVAYLGLSSRGLRLASLDRARALSPSPAVLHIVAHGVMSSEGGEIRAYRCEPGFEHCFEMPIPVTSVAAAARAEAPPLAAVCAACWSACAVPGMPGTEATLAQVLLRGGIPVVLGVAGRLAIDANDDLVLHFYGALAQGLALDQAAQAVRAAMWQDAPDGPGHAVQDRWWRFQLLCTHLPALDALDLAAGDPIDTTRAAHQISIASRATTWQAGTARRATPLPAGALALLQQTATGIGATSEWLTGAALDAVLGVLFPGTVASDLAVELALQARRGGRAQLGVNLAAGLEGVPIEGLLLPAPGELPDPLAYAVGLPGDPAVALEQLIDCAVAGLAPEPPLGTRAELLVARGSALAPAWPAPPEGPLAVLVAGVGAKVPVVDAALAIQEGAEVAAMVRPRDVPPLEAPPLAPVCTIGAAAPEPATVALTTLPGAPDIVAAQLAAALSGMRAVVLVVGSSPDPVAWATVSAALVAALQAPDAPRLVLVCGRDTGTAEEAAELASEVAGAAVVGVLAEPNRLEDATADRLVGRLLYELAQGTTLGEAVTATRLALFLERAWDGRIQSPYVPPKTLRSDVPWARLALWGGDPEGRLVGLGPEVLPLVSSPVPVPGRPAPGPRRPARVGGHAPDHNRRWSYPALVRWMGDRELGGRFGPEDVWRVTGGDPDLLEQLEPTLRVGPKQNPGSAVRPPDGHWDGHDALLGSSLLGDPGAQAALREAVAGALAARLGHLDGVERRALVRISVLEEPAPLALWEAALAKLMPPKALIRRLAQRGWLVGRPPRVSLDRGVAAALHLGETVKEAHERAEAHLRVAHRVLPGRLPAPGSRPVRKRRLSTRQLLRARRHLAGGGDWSRVAGCDWALAGRLLGAGTARLARDTRRLAPTDSEAGRLAAYLEATDAARRRDLHAVEEALAAATAGDAPPLELVALASLLRLEVDPWGAPEDASLIALEGTGWDARLERARRRAGRARQDPLSVTAHPASEPELATWVEDPLDALRAVRDARASHDLLGEGLGRARLARGLAPVRPDLAAEALGTALERIRAFPALSSLIGLLDADLERGPGRAMPKEPPAPTSGEEE